MSERNKALGRRKSRMEMTEKVPWTWRWIDHAKHLTVHRTVRQIYKEVSVPSPKCQLCRGGETLLFKVIAGIIHVKSLSKLDNSVYVRSPLTFPNPLWHCYQVWLKSENDCSWCTKTYTSGLVLYHWAHMVCWEAGMTSWRNGARVQENEVPLRRVWSLMPAGWPSRLWELAGSVW